MADDSIAFDKKYWPECGARIEQEPKSGYDLNDLWESYPDQASVFVADALISNKPNIYFVLDGKAEIEVFLWSVGGDTLQMKEPLAKLIDDSCRVSRKVRSDIQADEAMESLAGLQNVAEAVNRAIGFLKQQIANYEASK